MDAPGFAPQFIRPPFGIVLAPQSHIGYRHSEKPRNCYIRDNHTTNATLKTELCRTFYYTGNCKYGDACIFAHVSGERRLKEKPLSWQKSVGDVNMTGNSIVRNETNSNKQICRFYPKGRCPYNRCIYLHERLAISPKNDMPRESSAINIQTVSVDSKTTSVDSKTTSVDSKSIRDDSKTNPWLKTRLCNRWMELNSCPFGAKCTYAHGYAELRQFDTFRVSEPGNTWTASRTFNKNYLPNDAGKQTPPVLRVQPKVCLFKWKTFKKIVNIYADWIDEESHVPSAAMEIQQ